MRTLKGKKLLLLGGKPIGSKEIISRAKEKDVYTIVTDYLDIESSPAKQIADESWNISTAEIETLADKAKQAGIDGITSGVHEFNIRQMIKLCKVLNLPCYCSMEQWEALENKSNFKNACRRFGIPVTKEFNINETSIQNVTDIDFPIITKPADGSGSRGFSICHNLKELENAYFNAKKYSDTGSVLVESFMDYHYSVIINYTIIDGTIIYCGISDKRSKKVFETGAPIMSFQIYPSEFEEEYFRSVDTNAKAMLKSLGLRNGVVWIEAFCEDGKFTFNELGFRFGGSLTYYPVSYYTGIDQLDLQIEYALTGGNDAVISNVDKTNKLKYCILPTHVKPGTIKNVVGLNELMKKEYYYAYVPVHFNGDIIQAWGSAQQVFAYVHFLAKDKYDVADIQKDIMETLHVYDEAENELLFNLFDESIL